MSDHNIGDTCPSCAGSGLFEDKDKGTMPCLWSDGDFFCVDGVVGTERKRDKKKRSQGKARSVPPANQDSDSNLREFAVRLGKERQSRELEIAKKLAKAEGDARDAEIALSQARAKAEQARLSLTTASRQCRSEKEALRLEMQRREHAILMQAKARRRFDLEFAAQIRRERLDGGEDQASNDVWYRERCAEVEESYSEIVVLVRGIEQ